MDKFPTSSTMSVDTVIIESDSDMEPNIPHDPTKQKPKRGRDVWWTDDEHRLLMEGLEKHGKGQWERISKEYVKSRTARQIYLYYHRSLKRHGSLKPTNKTKTRRKPCVVIALAAKNSTPPLGNPNKNNSTNPPNMLGPQALFVPNPSALNQMSCSTDMNPLAAVTDAQNYTFGGLSLDEGPTLKIESKNVLSTSEQDLDSEELQFVQDLIVEPKIELVLFWESIENQSTIGYGVPSGSQVLSELRNMEAYQNSDWSFDQEDIWAPWG